MDRNEIKAKLGEIFRMVMGNDTVEYTDETELVAGLGLNSVGVLYLVIAIEEFFNVRFDESSVSDFRTVGDVVDFIQSKTA